MAKLLEPVDLPRCPECGERPKVVNIESGSVVTVPNEGTAVGSWSEVEWATRRPGATIESAPDFDVISLEPCGHMLRHGVMIEYRKQMRALIG